jgi:nudix-type nucleoside diphosphatase (YffH/AdpP family)
MNPAVEIVETQVLSDDWYTLRKVTFRHRGPKGSWSVQSREAYDRGNGAALLLYNSTQDTVVLTRQFRLPTYLNGNPDGMLVEVCAGLLDGESPETAIRREAEEETGFTVLDPVPVFQAYMSPGSVTERLHFFAAAYGAEDKTGIGGGTGEDEQIEVLELTAAEAWAQVADGRIQDGKTLLLLQHAALAGWISGPPARSPRAGTGSI